MICPNKFKDSRVKSACSNLSQSNIKVEKVVNDPKKPMIIISRVTLLKILNVEDNSITSPNKKQPRILTIKIPQGKSMDSQKLGRIRLTNCSNVYRANVPNAPAKANSVRVLMF